MHGIPKRTRGQLADLPESRRRLLRSVLFCMAMLATLVIALAISEEPAGASARADAVDDANRPSDAMMPSGTYSASIWQSLKRGYGIERSIESSGLRTLCSDDLPGWMVEELVDPDRASEIYATQDLSVVGMSIEGSADDELGQMLSTLEGKGWLVQSSGYSGVFTAIKEEGECRWMVLEARVREGGLDVVMHIGLN